MISQKELSFRNLKRVNLILAVTNTLLFIIHLIASLTILAHLPPFFGSQLGSGIRDSLLSLGIAGQLLSVGIASMIGTHLSYFESGLSFKAVLEMLAMGILPILIWTILYLIFCMIMYRYALKLRKALSVSKKPYITFLIFQIIGLLTTIKFSFTLNNAFMSCVLILLSFLAIKNLRNLERLIERGI